MFIDEISQLLIVVVENKQGNKVGVKVRVIFDIWLEKFLDFLVGKEVFELVDS